MTDRDHPSHDEPQPTEAVPYDPFVDDTAATGPATQAVAYDPCADDEDTGTTAVASNQMTPAPPCAKRR